MSGYVTGIDRSQTTLFPDRLEDFVGVDNPVRAVDAFVDASDFRDLGFVRATPAATGRPGYDPAVLLKLYVYGYLNRIPSSRRLEREAQRNVELMWLTGRLAPDHKTIADFRRDNGPSIRKVCSRFVLLCRQLGLLGGDALVAIDGSKFKAVNNRDANFTPAKLARRMGDLESAIGRYLAEMDETDRAEPMTEAKVERLSERIERMREELERLKRLDVNTRRSETRSRCGGRSMISSSKSSQCQDPDRRRLRHSPFKHFLRYIRDLRDLLDGVQLRRVFTGSETVRRWPQVRDELVALASGRP